MRIRNRDPEKAKAIVSQMTSPATPTAYDRHRERARERQAAISATGREIGEIPAAVDLERRASCERDFGRFCRVYLPATFALPWGRDHLTAIERIERSTIAGGLFAFAMPRGSGKTSLCEAAALWAILYGWRRFVLFIGADDEKSVASLESLQIELRTNERLAEDFPDVVYPIQCLGGIASRKHGQTHDGDPTFIGWGADELVLPTIAGSSASAAIVRATGITGSIRGARYKRPDGTAVRPDFVVVDDPQTDASARSASQVREREYVVSGAILGLAGPGKKIAGFCPCTVIRAGDLADRLLDREIHPEWRGERFKLLDREPDNVGLWAKYDEIRRASLQRGGDISAATAFYRANRAAMDAGAVVSWPERFNPDEASAIQHAMNWRLSDPVAFAAEAQQQPIVVKATSDDLAELSSDEIAGRVNEYGPGEVPADATTITAFIDVQLRCLFYAVFAWSDSFNGWCLLYGTFPDQRQPYFTYANLARTLGDEFPDAAKEGAILAGLVKLIAQICGTPWKRPDGVEIAPSRILIDAGFQSDIVRNAIRQSPYGLLCTPSHGRGIGAANVPITETRKKPGEKLGLHWRLSSTGRGALRHCAFDANFWKSFFWQRLTTAPGDRGSITLYNAPAAVHRMISEHWRSEFATKTQGRGRTVYEWRVRPNGGDNHLWDCAVGATVAASMAGVELASVQPTAPVAIQRRTSFADIAKRKRS